MKAERRTLALYVAGFALAAVFLAGRVTHLLGGRHHGGRVLVELVVGAVLGALAFGLTRARGAR